CGTSCSWCSPFPTRRARSGAWTRSGCSASSSPRWSRCARRPSPRRTASPSSSTRCALWPRPTACSRVSPRWSRSARSSALTWTSRPAAAAPRTAAWRPPRSPFYPGLRGDPQDLLLLALADAAAVTGASPLGVWRRAPLLRDLLGGWQEQQAVEAAAPLLRGEDVMGRLGLGPGPAVGRALARVREAQALGRVKTGEPALAYLHSRKSVV